MTPSTDKSHDDHEWSPSASRRGRLPVSTVSRRRVHGPKDEIAALRIRTRELEGLLRRLQDQRQQASAHKHGPWRRRAYEQSTARAAAVRENEALVRATDDCRRLSVGLSQLLRQQSSVISSLSCLDESEWMTNTLGRNAELRHVDAIRIMERLHRRLCTWAITSGIIDAKRDTRFSTCTNRDLPHMPIVVQVNTCRRLRGHFADIANRVWTAFIERSFQTSRGTSLDVNMDEVLGDDIRHVKTTMHFPGEGHSIEGVNNQLHQRVVERDRVVIMWKSVQDSTTPPISIPRHTENADGWISFQRTDDPLMDADCCLMHMSSSVDVVPLPGGNAKNLVSLLQLMNLADEALPPEYARAKFADFLLETLWVHATYVEGIAVDASRRLLSHG